MAQSRIWHHDLKAWQESTRFLEQLGRWLSAHPELDDLVRRSMLAAATEATEHLAHSANLRNDRESVRLWRLTLQNLQACEAWLYAALGLMEGTETEWETVKNQLLTVFRLTAGLIAYQHRKQRDAGAKPVAGNPSPARS